MTDEGKEERRVETLHLALLAQDGDEDALDELCDKLRPMMISIHAGLSVKNVILKGEITSLGRDGVINALGPFDHSKSNNFGFYCYRWIKNVMEYEIRDRSMPMHIPSSVYAYRRRCRKAIKELREELDRDPTNGEIAERAEMSIVSVTRVMNAPTSGSISSINKELEEGGSQLEGIIADIGISSPGSSMDSTTKMEYVMDAMDSILKPRAASMVCKLYGVGTDAPLSLEKIGAEFKVSPERVRQIVARSLSDIRRAANNDGEF